MPTTITTKTRTTATSRKRKKAPRVVKTKEQTYMGYLLAMMRWRDGIDYPKDHEFSKETLAQVTPLEVARWMKSRVYDNPDANETIDRPKKRSKTVLFWKKAVSYYMPNKRTDWNEIANVGNPTRSGEVNDLVKAIKKMETARLGAESQARRALYPEEYEQCIEMLEQIDDWEVSTFAVAFFRFQLHFIARGDDSAKLRLPDIKPFHQYEHYGITGRLCWSKNVFEDRDAPTQLLVGSMSRIYCVLIGMAIWLEWHFTCNPEPNEFAFGIFGEEDPITIKEHAYESLADVFQDSEFNPVDDGKKGTHSVRKTACDIGRGSACSKDDLDHRARWTKDKRQQDDYTSTTIPFVDAKVAFSLCKGGACYYRQKEESGMTDQWILDYVMVHSKQHLPRQVAIVLGRAALWQMFDATGEQVVPPEMMKRVMDATADLKTAGTYTVPEGENPVAKVPLICDGVDSQLIIEEAFNREEDGGDGDHRVVRRMDRQEVRMLASQIVHLRRELAESRQEAARDSAQNRRDMRQINANVARLAQRPGYRVVPQAGNNVQPPTEPNNGEGGSSTREVATLSRGPKTLHDLWYEWEHGYAGKKAARLFTAEERGKVKHTFYKRNIFWQKCGEMIRASQMDAQVACDKIYEVYGQNQSVTKILEAMKRDHIDRGGHPQLRNLQL